MYDTKMCKADILKRLEKLLGSSSRDENLVGLVNGYTESYKNICIAENYEIQKLVET